MSTVIQAESAIASAPCPVERLRRSACRASLFTWIACGIAPLVTVPEIARGQAIVSASPDVTVALGTAGVVTRDHDVAVDNQAGIVALESLGALPVSADVTAYDVVGPVRRFALDTTVQLSGVLIAQAGDVVSWDGASYSIVFDASAAGIPDGVRVDAISAGGAGLILSFDTAVICGSSPAVWAADEDLVRINPSGFCSTVFDGSAAGLPAYLDVDAAQYLGGGVQLLSFDTSGTVGSLSFQDEDVVRYTPGSGFSLEVDMSALDSDWENADLDALQVPEPRSVPSLFLGVLASFGWARKRDRASAPTGDLA